VFTSHMISPPVFCLNNNKYFMKIECSSSRIHSFAKSWMIRYRFVYECLVFFVWSGSWGYLVGVSENAWSCTLCLFFLFCHSWITTSRRPNQTNFAFLLSFYLCTVPVCTVCLYSLYNLIKVADLRPARQKFNLRFW
jgi:hypothetical protein